MNLNNQIPVRSVQDLTLHFIKRIPWGWDCNPPNKKMKAISFKVTVGTLVNQVFLIPKNYKIKSNSLEELYEDIYSKYGNEDMQNLLVELVDPRRYQDDPYNLECTGFGTVIVFDPDSSTPKRDWKIIKLKDFKNS